MSIANTLPEELVAAIERHGMGEHVLFCADKESDPHLCCPRSRVCGPIGRSSRHPAHLQDLMEALRPKIIAFDNRDFDDATIARSAPGERRIFVDWLANDSEGMAGRNRPWSHGYPDRYPDEFAAFSRSNGYK